MALNFAVSAQTPDPADRLRESYAKLAHVAPELNAVSDELGKSIEKVEAVLRKLGLGVVTWFTFDTSSDQYFNYTKKLIGYRKSAGKWRIMINLETGDDQSGQIGSDDYWPFNEAPRDLRVEAVAAIPDLLEKLHEEALGMIKKTKASRELADKMVAALEEVASDKKK